MKILWASTSSVHRLTQLSVTQMKAVRLHRLSQQKGLVEYAQLTVVLLLQQLQYMSADQGKLESVKIFNLIPSTLIGRVEN